MFTFFSRQTVIIEQTLFIYLKWEISTVRASVLCRQLVMSNGKVPNINSMHDFFYEPCMVKLVTFGL